MWILRRKGISRYKSCMVSCVMCFPLCRRSRCTLQTRMQCNLAFNLLSSDNVNTFSFTPTLLSLYLRLNRNLGRFFIDQQQHSPKPCAFHKHAIIRASMNIPCPPCRILITQAINSLGENNKYDVVKRDGDYAYYASC